MKRRVLQIVPHLHPGGTSWQAVLLTHAMIRQGYHCGVLSVGGSGQLRERLCRAGAEVRWMESGSHRMARSAISAYRWITAFQPELLHTWGVASNRWGYLVDRRIRSCRWIATCRSLSGSGSPRTEWLDRRLTRRAAACVANSEVLFSQCAGRGFPAERLVRIFDGVAAPPELTASQRARRLGTVGIPAEANVAVVASQLLPARGVKDLIWATDLLKNIRDDFHCVIVGQGPHLWRLRRFCRQVRVQDRVHFVGREPDAAQWIAAADVYWYAGRGDTVPRGVLQAMALGKPTIVSDVAIHRELVQHELTGCCVRFGDRAGYARQMNRVLNDRPWAMRLGQAAQDKIDAKFSLQATVAQYAELYRTVLGGTPVHSNPHFRSLRRFANSSFML